MAKRIQNTAGKQRALARRIEAVLIEHMRQCVNGGPRWCGLCQQTEELIAALAAPVGETEMLPWKCPHCDRHYTRPAAPVGETPAPEHRCGVRGFAESGDKCPGCVASGRHSTPAPEGT